MSIVLETSRSALRVYELPENIIQCLHQSIQLIELDEDKIKLDYHPTIKIFGKECHQQRSIGFYSNETKGYNYSTTTTNSKPLFRPLEEVLHYVNELFSSNFNGILINKYENGLEYIGKHSDDERGLYDNNGCGVIALSVGAVRKFRIRNKKTGEIMVDLPTLPNQIIQMAGDFQKEFTHEIPIEKKIKECRYSFTFRSHQ